MKAKRTYGVFVATTGQEKKKERKKTKASTMEEGIDRKSVV